MRSGALFRDRKCRFRAETGLAKRYEAAFAVVFPAMAGVEGSLLGFADLVVASGESVRSVGTFRLAKLESEIRVSVDKGVSAGDIPGLEKVAVKSSGCKEKVMGCV